MKKFLLLFILINQFSSVGRAAELFEMHRNARALGMGGAYVSVVDDENSLFFNPAGILKFGGISWTVADPAIGASDITSLSKLSDLADATKFEATLNSLYGEPLYAGGSGKSALMLPYFGIAYYYDMDISFLAQNPVSPTIDLGEVADKGYAIGTGFSIGSIFQMGFVARYATRTGARKTWGAGTISDIVAGIQTPDVIFDAYSATGTGYALDLGTNFNFPGPVSPTVSFVWKDIGNTKYSAGAGEENPPTQPQNMILGTALMVDLLFVHVVPAIEFRHLEDTTIDLGRKAHLGLEVGLPLIDVRAGLYQGYYTYGASLDLGLVKVDFASWGQELGSYAGQFEGRRYMVQLTMEIGFDLGIGGGGSSGGVRSSGSSGGGGGKGGSIFKRKKPKLRR